LDGTAAGWNSSTAVGFTYMNVLGNAISKNGKILSAFNNRVWKFDALTGAFEGYIGQIATTKPTGGDTGCTTMSTYSWTPGWCTGPASMDSNGPIGNGSGGVASDGTYIYLIGNGNSAIAQITRYLLSTGQYQGWRGEISVSPTGGDTGCNGAAVGTVTPGWCTGGNSQAGSQNGAFISAKTLSMDNMGNLLVGDTGLGRIMKFVLN
jgi:hypothetical protein